MTRFLVAVIGLIASASAVAADGMQTLRSAHPVDVTIDRLEQALKSKGMTVFARIDHAAGAKRAGHSLRPTELLVFGNPKVGTPLMNCQITVAIDLPQKALAWEDANGQVWLAYNDPSYLARRHAIDGCQPVLDKIAGALRNFAEGAVAP